MSVPPDSQSELTKTIARLVEEHAQHGASFVMAPGETIDPSRVTDAAATRALRMAQKGLSPIGARTREADVAAELLRPRNGLTMGKTLGQGGMGIVREAKQLAVDRDVAVKSIQPKLKSDAATRMLMQEALILGRLEHPNILPIYDIRHDDGEPRIVLKKVEGIEWSTLMHRPDVVREDLGEPDALDWSLRILITVCNAVHFAHSRGILHRDLKPDNVMIGEFGEVYVMDWGLALCLEDDGSGRFPLARDAKELAGTPQYMAPEMLGGKQAHISVRTDVYLLGAILFEIIAGHPPHRGKDMKEMLSQIATSRPVLPDSCPPELSRICRMAMDPDPGWRFESVEALRLALVGFRQHADSRRLANQAERRAQELLACLAEPAPHTRDLRRRIQSLFGEARFAYRQALETWPENEVASAGLSRVMRAMIEYELSQNNPRSAAALVAALDHAEPELRKRVDAAVALFEAAEQRMEDLERFRKQLDIRTGGRNRAIGAGLLGLIWTVAPLFAAAPPLQEIGRLPIIAFPLGVLVALGVWARIVREQLKESSITRRLMLAASVAMTGQFLLELAGISLGIDSVIIEAMWPLLWFCVSAMLVATVDARLLPMTLGFLGALTAAVTWPDLRFYAMCASNVVMSINMFSIWMPWRGDKSASTTPEKPSRNESGP